MYFIDSYGFLISMIFTCLLLLAFNYWTENNCVSFTNRMKWRYNISIYNLLHEVKWYILFIWVCASTLKMIKKEKEKPDDMKIFPYRAAFDIECMMEKETSTENTAKTTYLCKHKLALHIYIFRFALMFSALKTPNGSFFYRRRSQGMMEYLLEI